MKRPGHLFVAHGALESIAHDAAIVPVDSDLDFNPSWLPLFKEKVPDEPATFAALGWGKAPDREQIWIVDIIGGVEVILQRVAAVLADIKQGHGDRAGFNGRALPLVVMPVFGIGLGGLSHQRGHVIGRLVARLTELANDLEIDLVVVARDPAVHAALQYARRDLVKPLPSPYERQARELGELARSGQLALFLGAGVSMAAGLPSWKGLIDELAAGAPGLDPEDLKGLTEVDQAELIQREDESGFAKRVAKIAKRVGQPSLLHALLAGLDVSQVVTTNYDRLYERAVKATGRSVDSVMPWVSAVGAGRWILKLHGDVEHPKMIVLTRRHMVRYDASNRPSAALLQSLLLTRKLLMVGVSLKDDNVIRLAHEVQEYREEYQGGGKRTFGTVLDIGDGRVRSRLWEKQLDWVHLDEMRTLGRDGAWALELFLDRVGYYAAHQSSWLLDDRFEKLLKDPTDVTLARDIRALYARLPKDGSAEWTPLVERLEELGARDPDGS